MKLENWQKGRLKQEQAQDCDVAHSVRRGSTVPCPTRVVNGVTVSELPEDSPRIAAARVAELDAEQQ